MVTIAKGLEYLIFRISFKNFELFIRKIVTILTKDIPKETVDYLLEHYDQACG